VTLMRLTSLLAYHNITVIEECSPCLGGVLQGEICGYNFTIHHVFLSSDQTPYTGDGGALACLDEDDYRKAVVKRWVWHRSGK